MMRLRAVRLQHVGCFSTGIALEGFGDGLNVLSAPNEFGKSTVLGALRFALKFPHTSIRAADLVPYLGGDPLIEIDFETRDGRWRLRKHYLKGKSAALTDLNDPARSWRNLDVQARLDDLLRGPIGLDRFDVLWVTQKDGLGARRRDVEDGLESLRVGPAVSALIGAELDTLSMDAHTRAVHDVVIRRLGELQNANGRSKKGGAWQIAVDACEKQDRALAAAAQRASEHAGRLAALGDLVAERAAFLGDGADGMAALTATRDGALKRIDDAQATLRHEREAQQSATIALGSLERAKQVIDVARQKDADVAEAAHGVASLTAELAELRLKDAEAGERKQQATLGLADAAAKVADLEVAAKTARAAEQAHVAGSERQRLVQRLTDARTAVADLAEATTEAAALAAFTAIAVDRLDQDIRDRDNRDAGFAAIAPEVTITLAAGVARQVRANGTLLEGDATFNPDSPLDIDIAGIGRIRIAPHPPTANADAQALRAAARGRVDQAFATLGVATIADARDRLTRRQAAENAAHRAAQRLAQLAPDGLDALSATHANLAHILDDAALPVRSSAELELDLALARQRRDDADAHARSALATLAQHDQRRAAAEAAHKVHSARLAQLLAARGADAEARTRQEAAAGALRDATTTFENATLAHTTWRDKLTALAVPALEADAQAAATALATATRRLQHLDLEITRIEGALQASNDEDIQAEHARLQNSAALAHRALADIIDERDALRLLDRTFAEVNAEVRDQIAGPIQARIGSYLAAILPGASLGLDGEHAPQSLIRNATSESLDRLSQGTREQIAIVARLGLARLLAESDAGVPLVLDDALVFADDHRIAQMFQALEEAAAHHQVIVFNCREQTFAALARSPGAKGLTLSPWTPA